MQPWYNNRTRCGMVHYNCKYTDAQVREVLSRKAKGQGPTEIAREMGIPEGSIKNIYYRRGRLDVK